MPKILVVDDVKAEREMMRKYLVDAGYNVITANDGKEALDIVSQDKPDAIVTDWMMAQMGGLDICRNLKTNPETASIPIVACTAKSREVDRLWAKKQGIKGYVTKPYSPEQLVNALKEVME